MSKVLENLLYTKSHEWVKVEGNVAYIGVTDYAQASLGDVVYVEGYEEGETVTQFECCGAIESVKAASDINSPVSGTVLEVNSEVVDNPELINDDAYENYILKVEIDDLEELTNLLTKEEYEKEIK